MAHDPKEPDEPSDLSPSSWFDILKRTVKEFQDDNLTDWAAALTYYAVMSLFPMLVVLVALLGGVGQVLLVSLVPVAVGGAGPIAGAVGGAVGAGDTAVTVWGIAKWPVLLVVLMAMVAGLYYIAPNVRQPRLRWVTPGGIVAVVTWILDSAGFGLWVSNLGYYGKTYGTLGSVIMFLVWMWLSNVALLFGGE